MRLRRGLSLGQLARRMGTSAPTISRYENGWSRFELHTLQKLATALGCRLRIELEPEAAIPAPGGRSAVVRQIGRLFWDRPLRAADLVDYPAWVVKRVLEYGTLADVESIRDVMGRKAFLAEVAGLRFDTDRTRVFWQTMLEKEGIPCTAKYSRKAVPNSWPA